MAMNHIEVGTKDYEFTYGRAPGGRGSWAFDIDGEDNLFWYNGLYSEARKAAKKEAVRRGVSFIVVMT